LGIKVNNIDENLKDTNIENPGIILKNIRESKSLSIEKVANELHLSDEIIIAIEQDDYDKLSAPVFVRGYLVNYAKLLEIPSAQLLHVFEEKFVTKEPKLVSFNLSEQKKEKITIKYKYGIFFILLVGFLMAIFNFDSPQDVSSITLVNSNEKEFIEKTTASNQNKVENDVSMPEKIMPETDDEIVNNEIKSSLIENTTNSDKNTVVVAINESNDKNLNVVGDFKIVPEANNNSVKNVKEVVFLREPLSENNQPINNQSVKNNPLSKPEPEITKKISVAVSNKTKFTFNATEDAWVKVLNNQGKKIINNLVKAGTTRTLYGVAPMYFVVGNSEGISLSVNGKNFNHKKYSKGNVSKFTLSESEVASSTSVVER
jgi:cytoskeleton protein RodZ